MTYYALAFLAGAVLAGLAVRVPAKRDAEEARRKTEDMRREAEDLKRDKANLEGRLERSGDALDLIDNAKKELRATFASMARSVAQESNDEFLRLADQNFGKSMAAAKGELDRRHAQFAELVKPLSENYGKLNPQIELLADQTQKLSGALADSRQVGHWGEVQLRRIVELAGMDEHIDFEEQATADGRRPDMVIMLPGDRRIVVDAKTPIAGFREIGAAPTREAADAARTRHAQAVRRQVADLSRKGYERSVDNSLDFVIMFVPGDQFLSAALKADAGLIEHAMSKRIVISTPATLIAVLWAVKDDWQKDRAAKDALKILDMGKTLYDRVLKVMEYHEGVRQGLESATKAYNKSVRSFERRLVPQGNLFAEMLDKSELPQLHEVGEPVRALTPRTGR